MNILVAVLCLVMGRPYQFYYFVPLVSFWFVVIYVVLAVWPRVTAALVKGELHVLCFRPLSADCSTVESQYSAERRTVATWTKFLIRLCQLFDIFFDNSLMASASTGQSRCENF